MGHECVLDGCTRSSVELRRIKNAKITAKRHRKWQEVRLQREQEEKKAAEEFLKWRRRERARLATYIYASAQNVDKESSRISQEYMNKTVKAWERKSDDYVCNTQTNQKKGTEKDIILDVCSLPTISIKEEPCQKALQEHHVGDGQKKSEDPTDFLQDALRERLQNEVATSRLIAEITDMKSRLDDILARPSKGHLEGCEKDGFECEKIKQTCASSENEHDRSNDSQLRERTVAEASQVANKPKCYVYLDHECFAHENQVASRMKCCVHNDYRVHALDSLKTNKMKFHPPSKASAALFACEQLKPESERSLLQQKRNGEQAFVIETIRSSKSSMAVTGVAQENDCKYISLSCHKKECGILQRVSQGLGELEAEGNILAPIEEDMHKSASIVQANAGYRFMKEHPFGIMKVPFSSSRPKCPLRASNLSPTHTKVPL